MNDVERKKFGASVARLRKLQGLTEQELATMAAVKDKTIRGIESGTFNVPFDVLNRVATVLGGELRIIVTE